MTARRPVGGLLVDAGGTLLFPDASRGTWRVAQGAREVLALATAQGVRVAVVANWDLGLRPLLDSLDLTRLTHAVVVSAEVGVQKPDPHIFRIACRVLGVSPSETVHVGDDPHLDGAAARAAGCTSLVFGRDVAHFDDLLAHLDLVERRHACSQVPLT